MLEFCSLMDSMQRSGKGIETSILVIEHESGKLQTVGDASPIYRYWKQEIEAELESQGDRQFPKTFPLPLKAMLLDWEALRDRFVTAIDEHAPTITSNAPGLRKQWHPDKAEEIVGWVKEKLGLA